jgi:hypothetical protein
MKHFQGEYFQEIHSVIASQCIMFYLCQISKKLKTEISKCTILFVVLCGYEIWPLTLKEKDQLRALKSMRIY